MEGSCGHRICIFSRTAEDARLFHTLEIIGMLASYRVLLSKLNILKASHARLQNGSFSRELQ
jgi:hypothetical protein